MLSPVLHAADSAALPTVIAKLRQTGVVSCQPLLPYFCSNLHVACAGQTPIEAFAFQLRASGAHGSITSAPGTDRLRQPYEGGRVEWGPNDAYVVLSSPQTNGYIKLLADGSYSFRYYPQEQGVMSLGRCQ